MFLQYNLLTKNFIIVFKNGSSEKLTKKKKNTLQIQLFQMVLVDSHIVSIVTQLQINDKYRFYFLNILNKKFNLSNNLCTRSAVFIPLIFSISTKQWEKKIIPL